MADTRTSGDKLCKFRDQDWFCIRAIKEIHGFHEDIAAIRWALNFGATVGATVRAGVEVVLTPKKSSKKSKKTT